MPRTTPDATKTADPEISPPTRPGVRAGASSPARELAP